MKRIIGAIRSWLRGWELPVLKPHPVPAPVREQGESAPPGERR